MVGLRWMRSHPGSQTSRLGHGILRKIISTADISVDEFIELLKK